MRVYALGVQACQDKGRRAGGEFLVPERYMLTERKRQGPARVRQEVELKRRSTAHVCNTNLAVPQDGIIQHWLEGEPFALELHGFSCACFDADLGPNTPICC